MKGLILSAGLALGLGGLSLAPAAAAPLAPAGVFAAPTLVDQVACRTVTKSVRRNGVTRITKTQQCTPNRYGQRRYYGNGGRVYDRRVYRSDRPYYRPAPRPGFTVRVNP